MNACIKVCLPDELGMRVLVKQEYDKNFRITYRLNVAKLKIATKLNNSQHLLRSQLSKSVTEPTCIMCAKLLSSSGALSSL